jgi:hypothetical protein
VSGRGRAAAVRIGRQGRDALAVLLDQRTPFGRLALVHVLMTAGDTLVTVSLASSLFFSISPEAAKGRVLLYLLLTMAPFAVVAPFLGPVIDQSRGARRAMVVTSAGCRAVMCLIMAGALKSLLLFPEAFTMLVLSKVYLVTKGSLVPLLVGSPADLGRTNAVTGSGAMGSDAVAPADASVDGASEEGGSEDTGSEDAGSDVAAKRAHRHASIDQSVLATSNARLGLLASLAGFVASVPAIGVLELLGGPWVLRLDMLVFAAGAIAGLRLPIRRATRRRRPLPESMVGTAETADVTRPWNAPKGPRAALGEVFNTSPEVTLALSAMSVLKGVLGFLTFFVAFELDRAGAAKWWYGFVLGSTMAGAIVGVLVVPRLRRVMSEPQMLAAALWLVAVSGVLSAVIGGRTVQAFLAFAIGVAGASAKPAFDALVQRHVPPASQGRAFARFETRLQLVWVLGALLPVAYSMPFGSGDIVIAAVAGVSALFYMTGRRAIAHHDEGEFSSS